MTWPDGSRVEAKWIQGFYLTVQLSDARAARAIGLLGTGDHSVLDDLNLPDGTHAAPGGPGGFDTAWLITDKTSLFDYVDGQTSSTFARAAAAPALPISPQALSTCQRELGDRAATFELDACAYDVTSTGTTVPAAAWHDQEQQRIDSAQLAPTATDDGSEPAPSATDEESEPAYTIGGETQTSTTSTAEPTGQGMGIAGPTLHLTGDLDVLHDAPTATITVQAGAVMVARAACPSDQTTDVWMYLSYTDDQDGSSIFLCGPQASGEDYAREDTDTAYPGEGYLVARQTGTLHVTLSANSQSPTPVSADLFADGRPLTALPAAFRTDHWTGTLTGTADSALLWTSPGNGKTWNVTPSDTVCASEYYGPALDDTGVTVLGNLCKHHSHIDVGPTDENILIVIFNRTGTPVPSPFHHSTDAGPRHGSSGTGNRGHAAG